MRFTHRDDTAMIRDTVAAFARDRVAEQAMGWNERGSGEELPGVLAELAELGLLGITAPERFGGAGMGMLELVTVLEELARADAGLAAVIASHSAAIEALASADAADGGRIGALARGEEIACTGTPGARAVIGAGMADVAVMPGEPWTLVQLESPEPTRLLGLRSATAAVVAGPGAEQTGVATAEVVALLRLGAAAIAVGIGARGLRAGVAYSLERLQFGEPIARFEPIQWMTADAATELETARLLVRRAAWLHDARRAWHDAAARACTLGLRHARRIADRVLQVHGGAGYTEDYPVERLYRDAHALHALCGSTQVARAEIAARLAASA